MWRQMLAILFRNPMDLKEGLLLAGINRPDLRGKVSIKVESRIFFNFFSVFQFQHRGVFLRKS
tara:strand:- start:730 stop:918 length:189 start_codon:yes stop_codon:yes gene_type:complete